MSLLRATYIGVLTLSYLIFLKVPSPVVLDEETQPSVRNPRQNSPTHNIPVFTTNKNVKYLETELFKHDLNEGRVRVSNNLSIIYDAENINDNALRDICWHCSIASFLKSFEKRYHNMT